MIHNINNFAIILLHTFSNATMGISPLKYKELIIPTARLKLCDAQWVSVVDFVRILQKSRRFEILKFFLEKKLMS